MILGGRAGKKSLYIVTAILLAATMAAHPAMALTLGEAVGLAMRSDPVFLSAQSDLDATRARSSQAFARLLPQISATAGDAGNRRIYTQKSTFLNNGLLEKYSSSSVQLNLTQPIWNHADRIARAQADIAVTESDYRLMAAGQDLLMRLVQAWFDVMQARDTVLFSDAQLQAAKQQAEMAGRGNKLGVMSDIEAEDALAKYEQAAADLAATESEQENKMAALEQIIGAIELSPPSLSGRYEPPSLDGDTLEHWLSQTESENPSVLAAQRALEGARAEVRKQRAGHEPTLDFTASHGNAEQGSGLTGGQAGFTSNLDTLGLQLNVPLFAGGGQNAKVHEALALEDKSQHELESALRAVRKDVKQAWFTWRASRARQVSALQGMKSAALALKAAESGKGRGVKAEFDVLQARKQDEGALRDWRKARYDMVTSYFKLKAAAGQLTAADLSGLDKEFE